MASHPGMQIVRWLQYFERGFLLPLTKGLESISKEFWAWLRSCLIRVALRAKPPLHSVEDT